MAEQTTAWLLHQTGTCVAPMTLIFFFLVPGAATVLFVLRPEWGPVVESDEEAVGAVKAELA